MVRGPKKKIFYSISFLAVIWIIDCLILVLAGHIDRKFFGG
jgi:hypothetical protein